LNFDQSERDAPSFIFGIIKDKILFEYYALDNKITKNGSKVLIIIQNKLKMETL
jgi:hypothetical protein